MGNEFRWKMAQLDGSTWKLKKKKKKYININLAQIQTMMYEFSISSEVSYFLFFLKAEIL
jgi:hypothetical protein